MCDCFEYLTLCRFLNQTFQPFIGWPPTRPVGSTFLCKSTSRSRSPLSLLFPFFLLLLRLPFFNQVWNNQHIDVHVTGLGTPTLPRGVGILVLVCLGIRVFIFPGCKMFLRLGLKNEKTKWRPRPCEQMQKGKQSRTGPNTNRWTRAPKNKLDKICLYFDRCTWPWQGRNGFLCSFCVWFCMLSFNWTIRNAVTLCFWLLWLLKRKFTLTTPNLWLS